MATSERKAASRPRPSTQHVLDRQQRRRGGQQPRGPRMRRSWTRSPRTAHREPRALPPRRRTAPGRPPPATARTPDGPPTSRRVPPGRPRPTPRRTAPSRPRYRAVDRAGGPGSSGVGSVGKSMPITPSKSPIGSPGSRPIRAVAPASKVRTPSEIARAAAQLGVGLQQGRAQAEPTAPARRLPARPCRRRSPPGHSPTRRRSVLDPSGSPRRSDYPRDSNRSSQLECRHRVEPRPEIHARLIRI